MYVHCTLYIVQAYVWYIVQAYVLYNTQMLVLYGLYVCCSPCLDRQGASITIMDIADATLIWIHRYRYRSINCCLDSSK